MKIVGKQVKFRSGAIRLSFAHLSASVTCELQDIARIKVEVRVIVRVRVMRFTQFIICSCDTNIFKLQIVYAL